MSNISQNATRYDQSNTKRVDILGRNTGQIVPGLEQQNGDPVIGFDCSEKQKGDRLLYGRS